MLNRVHGSFAETLGAWSRMLDAANPMRLNHNGVSGERKLISCAVALYTVPGRQLANLRQK